MSYGNQPKTIALVAFIEYNKLPPGGEVTMTKAKTKIVCIIGAHKSDFAKLEGMYNVTYLYIDSADLVTIITGGKFKALVFGQPHRDLVRRFARTLNTLHKVVPTICMYGSKKWSNKQATWIEDKRRLGSALKKAIQ